MAGKLGDALTPDVYDQQFVTYVSSGGTATTSSGTNIPYARYDKYDYYYNEAFLENMYVFYDGSDNMVAAVKGSAVTGGV
jgi:hypothetical protein